MANLLIATGTGQLILTSPDGETYTVVEPENVAGDTFNDIAYDGNRTYVIVGLTTIWASIDGGQTFVQQTIPANLGFGLVTGLGASGILKAIIWDGAQFVVVGHDTSTGAGKVGTSLDGEMWTFVTVGGANLDFQHQLVSIAFNGTTYVAVSFGFVGGSRFFSTTTPLGTWTLQFTSGTDSEYAFLKSNGSGFLAFSSANPLAAYSPDGLATWAETSSGAIKVNQEINQVIWDATAGLWIGDGELTGGHVAIVTTPTGAVFTTALDTGVPSIGGVDAGTVLRGAGGALFTWAGNTVDGQAWTSTNNGASWTSVGTNTTSSSMKDIVWTGALYAAYQIPDVLDDQLASSPDLLTWTGHYDDGDANIDILRLFSSALPPPPPIVCIPFEIQSPGDMPDSGAQFTCQRLYITANLDVSGVPQLITPTLIIDGVENVLPPITNTGRSTIEIPISKYHGRFFGGVRLDGCLTGRIEIFRIEADVWLGEQQESQ